MGLCVNGSRLRTKVDFVFCSATAFSRGFLAGSIRFATTVAFCDSVSLSGWVVMKVFQDVVIIVDNVVILLFIFLKSLSI